MAQSLPHDNLIDQFWTDFESGQLQLPVLPELAFQIHDLMTGDDYDPALACQAISREAGATAALVRAANSVLNRGRVPIATLDMAVMRLGQDRARSLVNAYLLKQLFHAEGDAKQLLMAHWNASQTMANRACYLADVSDTVEPAEALLLALLQTLGGLALVHWCHQASITHDTRPIQLYQAIGRKVMGAASRALLERWAFPEDVARDAGQFEHWYYASGDEIDRVDLCVLAAWSQREDSAHPGPDLATLPAYQKWELAGLPVAPGLGALKDPSAQARLDALAELLP